MTGEASIPQWKLSWMQIFTGLALAFASFLFLRLMLGLLLSIIRHDKILYLALDAWFIFVSTAMYLAWIAFIPALLFACFLAIRSRPTALECIIPGTLAGFLPVFMNLDNQMFPEPTTPVVVIFSAIGALSGIVAWLYWRRSRAAFQSVHGAN